MIKKLLKTSLVVMFCGLGVNAQCLDASYGQYPEDTYVPLNDGTAESITTLGYAGEYSVVEVTEGYTYTFSSDIPTDFLTISDEDGATAYASGEGVVTWVATMSGNVRFYSHVDSECAEEESTRARILTGTPACESTEALDLPYMMSFETDEDWNCILVENSNGSTSWSMFEGDETVATEGTRSIRYNWNADVEGDDWFFTQGLNLEGGIEYTVSFNYKASDGPEYTEDLEVAYGTAPESATMTNTVGTINGIDTNLDSEFETFSETFTPETTGVYYVGFHNISAPDQAFLYLDEVSVTSALSTANHSAANFVYGPNPVRNVLNLSYDNKISDITVYNLVGQQVLAKSIGANTGSVDMSLLPVGNYIGKVNVDGATKVIKIMKN